MSQFDTTADTLHARAESSIADVKSASRDGLDAFADVADRFGDALDESIRQRPYATLAIVAGIGFLFGAVWRR